MCFRHSKLSNWVQWGEQQAVTAPGVHHGRADQRTYEVPADEAPSASMPGGTKPSRAGSDVSSSRWGLPWREERRVCIGGEGEGAPA